MGLLDALKQYVIDAMPGGLLNAEIGKAANETANNIRAKGKAFERGLLDPNKYAGEALKAGLDMAGMAPLGLTVWHGSPHKFNKFDMSKIGTGEGAQAYGHGLYTAEAQDVGKEYARKLANVDSSGYANAQLNAQNLVQRFNGDKEWAKEVVKDQLANVEKADPNFQRLTDTLAVLEGKAPQQLGSDGYLYKVDIPDEAVARMLDWDKPLSQQAPEVQKALKSIGVEIDDGVSIYQGPKGKWIADNGQKMSIFNSESEALQSVPPISGKDIWNRLKSTIPLDKSDALKTAGIPGIRYLDGGSRSAGQGSSNFVLFSDDLPRILEINGQATGQVPWAPNEWRGLLK